MRSFGVRVLRWAVVPDAGSWTQLQLPGAVLATELFLINVNAGDSAVQLDSLPPPPREGCAHLMRADLERCAPETGRRDELIVRFAWRLNELPSGRTAASCSPILSGAHHALKGKVLSLRQASPAQACPFDVFIWVPTRLQPASNALCGGHLGVDVGSSAMDGLRGAIQLETACAAMNPVHPPSPPTSPPVTAPLASPPTVFAVLKQIISRSLNMTTTEIREEIFELGGDPSGAHEELAGKLTLALCVYHIPSVDLRHQLQLNSLPARGLKRDHCEQLLNGTGMLAFPTAASPHTH